MQNWTHSKICLLVYAVTDQSTAILWFMYAISLLPFATRIQLENESMRRTADVALMLTIPNNLPILLSWSQECKLAFTQQNYFYLLMDLRQRIWSGSSKIRKVFDVLIAKGGYRRHKILKVTQYCKGERISVGSSFQFEAFSCKLN